MKGAFCPGATVRFCLVWHYCYCGYGSTEYKQRSPGDRIFAGITVSDKQIFRIINLINFINLIGLFLSAFIIHVVNLVRYCNGLTGLPDSQRPFALLAGPFARAEKRSI